MPSQGLPMSLQEHPGTQYLDLAAAHKSALKATASELTAVLRSLLDSGALVQVDGRIIPANLSKG